MVMNADGRLSLGKGEGGGEGLNSFAAIDEPLTSVLSPCPRGEAGRLPGVLPFRR